MKNLKFFLLPVSLVILTTGCTQNSCDNGDCVVAQTYVHRYGVEVPQDSWTESGQCGQVITSLASGVNVTKNYEEGKVQGEVTYSFPHSEAIQKVETHVEGNLHKEVVNYPSGMPMKETRFDSATEQTVTWWYENSSPKGSERYVNGALVHGDYYNYSHQLESKIEDGQGTRISRDPYGLLLSTDQFQNGYQVSSIVYYPNGAPKESIPYARGAIEGQKKTFLPGGEPNTAETWVNGKQNGLTIIYQNGEKYAEVNYVNGQKDGVEKRYRDGSILAEEISWRADQLFGPSSTYVNGVKTTNWFYQGRPISKAVYERLAATP